MNGCSYLVCCRREIQSRHTSPSVDPSWNVSMVMRCCRCCRGWLQGSAGTWCCVKRLQWSLLCFMPHSHPADYQTPSSPPHQSFTLLLKTWIFYLFCQKIHSLDSSRYKFHCSVHPQSCLDECFLEKRKVIRQAKGYKETFWKTRVE